MRTFLQAIKEKRLHAERERFLRPRIIELEKAIHSIYVQLPRTAAMEMRPYLIDFLVMPQVRALVDAPSSQAVTRDDFLAMLPALGESWMRERKRNLEVLLKQQLGKIVSGTDPFELAMGMFFCNGGCGHAVLRYPEVLVHGCTRKITVEDVKKRYKDDDYTYTAALHHATPGLRARTWDEGWDGAYVPFNLKCVKDKKATKKALNALRLILVAMELDPTTTTFSELQACGIRLQCETCKNETPSQDFVYGWEAAVRLLES